MCGIVAILGKDDGSRAQNAARMSDDIAHRGPDGNGIWSDDNISLAHRRLAIIDLSSEADQPMVSATGRFVLVFNGEIYNYESIKAELPQYSFTTNGDTEVLLAGWEKWGVDVVQKLNGMFAFVMYDTQTKETWVVRDRLGVKPIYFTKQGNCMYVCSELKPILKHGIANPSLNYPALANFLRSQCNKAPETLVEDVFILEAGNYLHIDPKLQIAKKSYWKLAPKSLEFESRAHVVKDIRSSLISSVELRLVSDVPIGAFLSGGVDSSILSSTIAEILDRKLSTYSVVFDEDAYDESRYSQMVAKRLKTDHHEVPVKSHELLNHLPEVVDSMDYPTGDGINTYIISKAVKQAGITVALSGLGADELYNGYPIFKLSQQLLKPTVKLSKKVLRVPTGLLKGNVKMRKLREAFKYGYSTEEDLYPFLRKLYLEADITAMLSGVSESKARGSAEGRGDSLSRISVLDMQGYMEPVLLKDSDQMGMANSLEIRVPFLDHRNVELALSIPDQFKNVNRPKSLLIDAFADVLPSEVWNRKKMGFVLPWEQWLRGDLIEFVERGLEYFGELDRVNSSEVDKLWSKFLAYDNSVNWSKVWILVILGHWIRKNNIHG